MKIKQLIFIATLFTSLFTFAGSSQANSLDSSVNRVSSTTKIVSGTASKGATIYVRNAKKQTLGKIAVNANGKYSVKLNAKIASGQKLYVYVRKNGAYFYRIVTVNGNGAKDSKQESTAKKSTIKVNTNSVQAKTISLDSLTGVWKTAQTANGYQIIMQFSQGRGLDECVYKNGKLKTQTINYASYKITPVTNSFWKVTYKERGKKPKNFYIRLTSNQRFYLVDQNNHLIKIKIGNSTGHYGAFNLTK